MLIGYEKFTFPRIEVLKAGIYSVKVIMNSVTELASLQISWNSCQCNINTF